MDEPRAAAATEIRRATEADVAAIVDLNRRHNGDEAAFELGCTLHAGHVAAADFVVAAAGDRVVSTVGLLPLELRVGEVALPTGQPEFVATEPDSRGRGLIRRLLEVVHGWSAERGDIVQVIAGIPFFYRQFGYSYGLRRGLESSTGTGT